MCLIYPYLKSTKKIIGSINSATPLVKGYQIMNSRNISSTFVKFYYHSNTTGNPILVYHHWYILKSWPKCVCGWGVEGDVRTFCFLEGRDGGGVPFGKRAAPPLLARSKFNP